MTAQTQTQTLTVEEARAIDRQWVQAGMQGGMRLVSHHVGGAVGSRTFLEDPRDGQAPVFECVGSWGSGFVFVRVEVER